MYSQDTDWALSSRASRAPTPQTRNTALTVPPEGVYRAGIGRVRAGRKKKKSSFAPPFASRPVPNQQPTCCPVTPSQIITRKELFKVILPNGGRVLAFLEAKIGGGILITY